MRRLPGILLLTGAALVVIAALLVSGLRIALPHLDAWRPEILNKIESATGMPVEASQLSASWQNFGPTLEAHDIRAELKDGGEFSVKTRYSGAGCLAEPVTYALAVSRSHFLAAALSHQHSYHQRW